MQGSNTTANHDHEQLRLVLVPVYQGLGALACEFAHLVKRFKAVVFYGLAGGGHSGLSSISLRETPSIGVR